MTTSDILMNHSSDILFSQTHQGCRDEYGRTEYPIQINESEFIFGCDETWQQNCPVEVDTKNQKSKPTRKKELVTKDVIQPLSRTDTDKDMSTFERNKICETPNSNDTDATNRKKTAYSNDTDAKHRKKTANSNNTDATYRKKTTKSNGTDATYRKKTVNSNDTDATDIKKTTKSNDTDSKYRKKIAKNNGTDEFSWTGNNKDDPSSEGGKKGKKTDDNDKDRSQSSPDEQMDMKKEIKSEAKDLSQTVISSLVSKFICCVIDKSIEQGFKNTDFSESFKSSFMSSIETLKQGVITRVIRIFFKWLPTAVTRLQCVNLRKPLKYIDDIWEFIQIIKKLLDGRLTFWEAAKQIFIKAVFFCIRLFITYQFGTGGYIFEIFVSVALNVIEHLVNRFVQSYQK